MKVSSRQWAIPDNFPILFTPKVDMKMLSIPFKAVTWLDPRYIPLFEFWFLGYIVVEHSRYGLISGPGEALNSGSDRDAPTTTQKVFWGEIFSQKKGSFSEKTKQEGQMVRIRQNLVIFSGKMWIWIHFWQKFWQNVVKNWGNSVRDCWKLVVNYGHWVRANKKGG